MLASINVVAQRWVWLVLGWSSEGKWTISHTAISQPSRSTQPFTLNATV